MVAIVGGGLLANPIQSLFGGENASSWLSQAIAIFTVVLSPIVSQIGDVFGRKWPVTFALLCGFAGSIVASRAQSMGTVIAGFCVIGICFGAQPLLHAIVSEVLPRKQRPQAQASINVTASLGAFGGICLGGALLRNGNLENYRIYFYVAAAVFLAAALGVGFLFNPPPREMQITMTTSEKLHSLDWIGYALFTPGIVLFSVALSWSRNPYPWSNARIIATFVVGFVFLIGFAIYEWRFKKDGVLHHDFFHDRNFLWALLTIFVEGLVFFTANNFFAFEVSIFTQQDLLLSGLHFGMAFIGGLVFAFLAALYSSKRKVLRMPITVGFSCILIFNICMAATSGYNPGKAFWGFGAILGVGLGIILPLIMVTAQLCTPPSLISTASALIIAVRALGGTVGLAIDTAIFNSALSTEIPEKIAAAALPLGLPPSSLGMLIGGLTAHDEEILAHVPGITPQIISAASQALVRAYGVGFRNCWIAASCFCAVAVIGMYPHSQLDRPLIRTVQLTLPQ